MSPTTGPTLDHELSASLRLFSELPIWIAQVMDPEQVRAELLRHIPELADGRQQLTSCVPSRLRAKGDRWLARYELTVACPDTGDTRLVVLAGELQPANGAPVTVGAAPAGETEPANGAPAPFHRRLGDHSWEAWLPALRLRLRTEAADEALPILPELTDPIVARVLLEDAIGRHAVPGIRIAAVEPEILRYKPGSRCTLGYRLHYTDPQPGWPDTVVVKTHHGDKGANAFAAMQALATAESTSAEPGRCGAVPPDRDDAMKSGHGGVMTGARDGAAPSGRGSAGTSGRNGAGTGERSGAVTVVRGGVVSLGRGAVALARPLGYLPEQRVLVQSGLPGTASLTDTIRRVLLEGDEQVAAGLRDLLAATARGLAALHGCGVRHGRTHTWVDELAEVGELTIRLSHTVPELATGADPVIARLRRLAAAAPADPLGPAHHDFRPGQVMVHGTDIGFIDFDGFCTAEPALDIGRFRAKLRDIGVFDKDTEPEPPTGARLEARLVVMDELCDGFLAAYQAHAPVSATRVLLWETTDLLTAVLHAWTKVRLARVTPRLALLEHQLARLTQCWPTR